MEAPAQPVAWVIAKPHGKEMRQARRVFAAASLAPPGVLRLNVPHLTLELLYPPLPGHDRLIAALVAVARRAAPIRVPALGVVREVTGVVSVELALVPELVGLRQALAESLAQVGATLHPGPLTAWRPHLSVIGKDALANKGWARAEPDASVADYQFAVDSLTLSLPTRVPGRFREFGPYRLGGASLSHTSARR